jgi:hypothetical protein
LTYFLQGGFPWRAFLALSKIAAPAAGYLTSALPQAGHAASPLSKSQI